MNIAVIGAAGGVGKRIVAGAIAQGYSVRGLVRTEEQASAIRNLGARAVIGDLTTNWQDWQAVLEGADIVIWAAGAGNSGNFKEVDGDGLINVVDTLKQRGPKRLVVISSMGVDRPEQMPPFLGHVLRVKAVSDAYVQHSKLDWTIIRPAGLTDTEGTGHIAIGMPAAGGIVPRDDVAATALAALQNPETIGKTFELVMGRYSIAEALATLDNL